MKTFLLSLVLVVIIVSSCSSTYLLSKEEKKRIPKAASVVVVESSMPLNVAIGTVAKGLANDGWVVDIKKDVYQVITEPRFTRNGTTVRALITFIPTNNGTKISIRGSWGIDGATQAVNSTFGMVITHQSRAFWTKSGNSRARIAFENLAYIGSRIPDGKVNYAK